VKTLQGEPLVTAPGKLIVLGEYAVLDGFPAVVAAVNRRASGQFVPGREPESQLVDVAVRSAKDALGPNRTALPRGSVLVDTAAFSLNGTKMGIGSSAATAAVTVGAVLEMAGLSVADSTDLIFDVASSAHRAAQGGLGSGADVAAAVYGGLLHYTRPTNSAATIRRLPRSSASRWSCSRRARPARRSTACRPSRPSRRRAPRRTASCCRPLPTP
jgi:mevalonate kinase